METTKRIYAPHELQPSTPIHPGEILKDELEARGLSQRKFAQTIGVSYSVFNEVAIRLRHADSPARWQAVRNLGKHPQGCGDALTSKRIKARRKAVFRLRVPFFSYIELTLLTNSLR